MSIATEFDKFKDVLFNKKIIRHKMKRIQSKKHKLGTYEIGKISLSCFDDKRYVLVDRIHTLAYFHKDCVTSCKEIEKDCDNWKRSWWLKTIVIIEKGCDNWKRFWLKKFMLVLHACNFSSNVNEVIRVVLNSLFFLQKDFASTKCTKITKSTKDATKQKHKNANKQISDFFPLRFFLCTFFIFVRRRRLVLLVLVKFLDV